jgi:DNA (cytosine-5)-methyltransferase 1
MIGIDLFAGAGGMSLGALTAGIEVAYAVECDPHAAVTYKHNHSEISVFDRDIRRLSRRRIRRIPRGKDGTIVFGGPPCQGFSYSNQRTRKTANPDNWLFLEFIRVVRDWEPDWVVFENVKGITNTANGIFLEQVLDCLDKCGYTAASSVLDSADFGVPQHRERLFVIGCRGSTKPTIPAPTHRNHVTVQEAVHDLPPLKNGAAEDWRPYRQPALSSYARTMRGRLQACSGHLLTRNAPYVIDRYRHIPQGGNWLDIPSRLMRNYADRKRCHTGIYHRLHARQPSIVIGNYRKNMLIHPRQNRGLSVREAARIQSFPDWYQFKGSVGFQQQQVGNAVPPLLATAVFQHIVKLAGTPSCGDEGFGRDEQQCRQKA